MAKVARLFAVAVLVFGAFIGYDDLLPRAIGRRVFRESQAADHRKRLRDGRHGIRPRRGQSSKAGYVLAGWNTIAERLRRELRGRRHVPRWALPT